MFTEKNTLNFIDLFSGAGGLSEGFFNHSFNPIAHVEMNTYASETLKTRSCYYYLKKTKQLDVYREYCSSAGATAFSSTGKYIFLLNLRISRQN